MPVNEQLTNEQWERYTYARDRSHLEFVKKADKCDNFFIGNQWRPEDLSALELQRRPALTINKILATIGNANAFMAVQKEFGSFDRYIWQFTGGKTIDHQITDMGTTPVSTSESDAMSKDLKKRGFKFVGTTICYAYMQAAGMVNDHLVSCFRHEACRGERG